MGENSNAIGAQQLPRFVFDGVAYFADLRLAEFRGVQDFGKRIVFDSPEGQMACDRAGIASCRECGTHVVASGYVRNDRMWCVRCGVAVE